MGRTIPSFRIAAVLEEQDWKPYKEYLHKEDKKLFKQMFSISRLYNSACSYSSNPIRLYPILMSIIFHNYKTLRSRKQINIDVNYQKNKEVETELLKREMKSWDNYSYVLRKQNRALFQLMLKSSYQYSHAIKVKVEGAGGDYSAEALFISLIFEQYKATK